MIRRLVLLALALSVSLGLTAPAHAERWVGLDAAGDAISLSYSPDPEPCGTVSEEPTTTNDVRRFVVRHTASRVTLRLVADEISRSKDTSASFALVGRADQWDVDVYRVGDRVRTRIWTPAGEQDDDDSDGCGLSVSIISAVPCPGAHSTFDAADGVVVASIPRRCLGRPAWLRARADLGTWSEDHLLVDSWATEAGSQALTRRVYAPR